MKTSESPQKIGATAERTVMMRLRLEKFNCIRAPYISPFDLVVDGARVEVKCARPSNGKWKINIHRHGVIREERVDAYIFKLFDVPGCVKPRHLVLRAPLGVHTVDISFSALLGQYHGALEAWDLLHEICKEAREALQ